VAIVTQKVTSSEPVAETNSTVQSVSETAAVAKEEQAAQEERKTSGQEEDDKKQKERKKNVSICKP
jgi:hypothetical protein